MKYVSLHHHTTFSFMDGYGTPEQHIARAAEIGMSAQAVTEHGNVSSHVRHEKAAIAAGIKPIFGLEAYTAPADMRETGNTRKWHMTILAMNEEGYANLNRIVTRSWDEGFYRWPTVSGRMLRDHHEGLIVLSGCADSKLACDLLGGKGRETGDERDARRTIESFKRLLGDRYYLETQQFPELERTRTLNAWYAEQGARYGVPLVATADCHYPTPEENEMQKILHAAGRNTGTVAAAEAGWEYDIRLCPPVSDAEILKRLRATGLTGRQAEQAVASTAEIAERCSVVLPKMERVRYPIEQEPNYQEGMSNLDMFRRWLNDGWKYRGLNKLQGAERKRYIDRVNYETDLMVQKGFIDYFLMLSDAVRATKDAGVPVGPARGSAAASLVCYLLRITEIDPLQYPMMLFERFIDPNRHDLPDVDLDFDDELRDFVRQHMIKRYGADRVGNIGTFTRYKGKNAIDDVSRVYQIPKFDVDRAKEFLVERSGGDSRFDASIMDTVEMFPVVKEVFDKYPELYRTTQLEGNIKGMGVHAAGIVVGSGPLSDVLATYTRHNVGKNKNTLQAMSVDKYDGEHLGLLKLDALGLKTMGMIRHALEMLGMTLEDLYKIPMDDEITLKGFEEADVTGIFQFDGRTMRMVTQEMRPRTFMDLAAVNALARPGPLHSGSTGDYIAIRWGRAEVEHLHPIVDEITKFTEYQIIYQEQILQICRDVGKFPWVHAATIRKVISQKKGEAAFNELWEQFRDGAMSQGISEALANRIWKKMVTAGTYAFNIAHCVSYSMLGFWCMWLKQHHPIEFYTAQLRKVDPDPKKGKHIALMRDAQDPRYGRDLAILPPAPQLSGVTWMPAENGVRAGFSQIKGVGETTAKAMIEFRDKAEGGVLSWEEFVAVRGIGAKTILKIREFVEDPDPFGLNLIKNGEARIREGIRSGEIPIREPDTYSDEIPYEAKRSEHVVLGVPKARNLQDLFENHRSRTGEELDPKEVKDPDLKDSMTLYCEDRNGTMTIKVDRWKYPRFKDMLWGIHLGRDFLWAEVVKSAFYGKTVKVQRMAVICLCDEQGGEDEDEDEEDASDEN